MTERKEAKTERITEHDLQSATTYLRNSGIEVKAAESAESSRFEIDWMPDSPYGKVESLSKRDLVLFARGMRKGVKRGRKLGMQAIGDAVEKMIDEERLLG